MGVFKNPFHKEAPVKMTEIVEPPVYETDYLNDAEKLANVVTTGLDSEDFSGMTQQLTSVAPINQPRKAYVFEHPSVVSIYVAATVCAVTMFVFFYFLFIGVGTTLFSGELFLVGAILSGVSLGILFANICLIFRMISDIKYKIRFDVYSEFLGFKTVEYVEDLALCAKQQESKVVKDLNRAVKAKLIPQGHFSHDNLVFMVSDKVYDKYMEKSAVYDRFFAKQLEERHRIKSRTERIKQIMEAGEQYTKKLNDFKNLVKDSTVSQKIGRLLNVTSMIFHEIDVNPSQANSLGVFLNYYLPTTEKLLDTYISITEKKAPVANLTSAKKEIEDSLSIIIGAYENILEKLYEEYEMNIASDIEAMELVMKKEGL